MRQFNTNAGGRCPETPRCTSRRGQGEIDRKRAPRINGKRTSWKEGRVWLLSARGVSLLIERETAVFNASNWPLPDDENSQRQLAVNRCNGGADGTEAFVQQQQKEEEVRTTSHLYG
ncbi:hypothetical protein OUZ56_031798 [Daphnia magna]|uniref:Uncharacterized protein n=1 Tax=Daphnia magna TaxID=35525 RepID=A0ABQ9ZV82_9CRUS|nr:hypothetical protein OUZ56_031798 [Daphnia magna]